jgi:RND family efflux transporter MFP subunit
MTARWQNRSVAIAVAVLLITVVGFYYAKDSKTVPAGHPAEAAPSGTPNRTGSVRAEGRVTAYPGAEVVISSEITGVIARVLVDEKSKVKKGELMLEVRADEKKAALAEARARVKESKTQYWYAQREVERAKKLVATKTIPLDTFERTERDFEAARARFDIATATERRLSASLEKTQISAPIDGVVVARDVHPGESVVPGRMLFRVVDLTRLRVDAEVDEYDAVKVAVGAPVVIRVEGYADAFPGRVEEIPDAVILRRLKPEDPGKPSDTRILLVKVAFQKEHPLKLGQRVEVEIEAPEKKS